MYFSKYNLTIPLDEYPSHVVLQNLFHGCATILSKAFVRRLAHAARTGDWQDISSDELKELTTRYFVYDSEEDERCQVAALYRSFRDAMLTENPLRQYQILITYGCNLRCEYCFQKQSREGGVMNQARLDKALHTIDLLDLEARKEINARKLNAQPSLLSIVGGEPLQDDAINHELIRTIVRFARARGLTYALTSNGFALARFVPLFLEQDYLPGDIQVTLDGVGAIHDSRRPVLGGSGSFSSIISGIDAAIKAGIHISLRVNIDRQNIDSLASLCELFEAHGWSESPAFSAYIAPVTDHTGVNDTYEWIETDRVLFKELLDRLRGSTQLRRTFALKNFRGFDYVKKAVSGEGLLVPTFWRCEAVLGQVVLDPVGRIFSCFEGAGNADAQVGTYDPEYRLDSDSVARWTQLNALESPFCANCRFAFVCAGGCPWHIVHRGKTECMPIAQQVNLAWNYFADDVMPKLGIANSAATVQ